MTLLPTSFQRVRKVTTPPVLGDSLENGFLQSRSTLEILNARGARGPFRRRVGQRATSGIRSLAG